LYENILSREDIAVLGCGGCDSEALLQAVRCLGMLGYAIFMPKILLFDRERFRLVTINPSIAHNIMSETVYIETSVIGYLTARFTKNLIIAANMETTRDWWENRRHDFNLYISQAVLDEVAAGDSEIANKRLELLENFELLSINETVITLAEQFINKSNLPSKAATDAIHIALATIHGIDYLLTWNCKHIANAQIQKKLAQVSLDFGYEMPTICTPYELMER
jgi:predicted nucleic acid-binding protein